ncbi:hypothetical protein BHE74_00056732, partial [Ensete ventricosum]
SLKKRGKRQNLSPNRHVPVVLTEGGRNLDFAARLAPPDHRLTESEPQLPKVPYL